MDTIKGYWVADGYMGYVNGEYIKFASDTEYYEWVK